MHWWKKTCHRPPARNRPADDGRVLYQSVCKPVQGDDQSLAEGIQRVALGGADEIAFGIEGAPGRESPFLGKATTANSNGVDLSTFWKDFKGWVGPGGSHQPFIPDTLSMSRLI